MDTWDLILIKNCIVLKTLTYLHSDLLLCTGKYLPPFYFRPLSVGKFKTGRILLFIILEHNKIVSGPRQEFPEGGSSTRIASRAPHGRGSGGLERLPEAQGYLEQNPSI